MQTAYSEFNLLASQYLTTPPARLGCCDRLGRIICLTRSNSGPRGRHDRRAMNFETVRIIRNRSRYPLEGRCIVEEMSHFLLNSRSASKITVRHSLLSTFQSTPSTSPAMKFFTAFFALVLAAVVSAGPVADLDKRGGSERAEDPPKGVNH
ncbi:hypothetical protein FA95DRAFT_238688 [Auriscalpium vulgare]|uniref:Uncharacterized protein n=1 Tax=Auriscalpium vulgare TaxID=40419 RepID=A0ACB8S519_9AGAM|nr:hypothetical protein FA95DRAFT_238688 [Auriscalpium vulgare]